MFEYLNWHKKKYPLMEEDDLLLLIFQGVYAGRYSFRSKKEITKLLTLEIASLNRVYQDLYTYINDSYVRLNLAPYLKYKFPLKYLNLAFYHTAKENIATKEIHLAALETANIKTTDLEIKKHSQAYCDNYDPHYRVIDIKYLTSDMKETQLLNFLTNQPKNLIIAIEGKCGSGKTTMVNHILEKLPFTVIPMDDFFLPPTMRTTERLAEVGGNIDYLRILDLLTEIKAKKSDILTYKKYDCNTNKLSTIKIPRNDIIVLEGVYSYHPAFRHLVDKLVYINVDDNTQDLRLRQRDNYLSYVNNWVVLENIYYNHEKIKYLSDIII